MMCCSNDKMQKLGPEKMRPPLADGRDCLRYLCETDEDDAVMLLKALHQRRPQLMPRVLPPAAVQPVTPAASKPGTPAKPSTAAKPLLGMDTGENTDSLHHADPNHVALLKAVVEAEQMQADAFAYQNLKLDKTMPMVGFCGHQFFASEDDDRCVIDVMRLGSQEGRSVVNYQTRDWSAEAGQQYVAQSGQIIFLPGESIKEIDIKIIADDVWHTTLEFIVELLPQGSQNCMLDMYLYTSKVKLIDDDCFPTNKFAKQIRAREYRKIPGAGLVMEYFRLNFMDPVVRAGTIKMLMVDQLHNVYFVGKLFMNVYMVDNVLANKTDSMIGGDKLGTLIWLAVLNIVFFVLLYILDQRKHSWKVGGRSRSMLQQSLLRKFLNYDDQSRNEVDQGSLVMAMTRDSVNTVRDGYMNTIKLVRAIGQIVAIIGFLAAMPPMFGRKYRLATMLTPLITFSVLLVSFLIMRWRKTTHVFTQMNTKEDDLVDYVNGTAENYRLIADYNQRGKYVDRFSESIDELNKAIVANSIVNGDNMYFPQWVTVVLVSGYYIIGGTAVKDPNDPNSVGTSLGVFLSDIAVFTQIGLAAGVIYQCLLEMVTVFPPLERVTTLANLATDVPARGKISEWSRTSTRKRRAELIGKGDSRRLPVDLLPIRIEDFEIKGFNQSLHRKGLMEVRQGNLVALVGKRGQGKATTLKLLSCVLLPSMVDDSIGPGLFMPSHVRVLHISLMPLFFNGTLYENLTFGVKPGHPDGDRTRVAAICNLLRIPEKTIALLTTDKVMPWETYLSQTQKQALCLARAFITNPEVMCIHKPTQVFDPESVLNIMKLLRNFVTFKGIEMDASTWHLRRVRTCMFTSTDRTNVALADQVLHISNAGIKEIDKSHVTETDLC